MRIEVLYFAAAKDAAGRPSEFIELQTTQTAQQLLVSLIAKYPRLQKLAAQVRIAVNEEFVTGDHSLQAGDVVALIPPVAGG